MVDLSKIMDLNANLASLLTLIAAITAAGVSVINAWRNTTRAENVKAKLEEIHTSTNGNLSKLTEKINGLEAKAITDTENVRALQEIVKNLTNGHSTPQNIKK